MKKDLKNLLTNLLTFKGLSLTPTHRRGSNVAFTLAETLITLAIIGIVAALVMPGIITNYQKQQTVAQLKKVYSLLNQVYQKSIVDNGGNINTWSNVGGYNTRNEDGTRNGDLILNYFLPYLEVVSKFDKFKTYCQYRDSNGTKGYKIFSSVGYGTSYYSWEMSPYGYVLKDGTILVFRNFLDYSPMANAFYILADLNGFKGPNRIGRDVFVFALYKNNPNIITTPGYNSTVDQILTDTSTTNSCLDKDASTSSSYSGGGCSTIIMKDGWKIKDHYPWW